MKSEKPYCEVGMNTLVPDLQAVKALTVSVSEDTLTVDLSDGRTISVPLAWYPRLVHGSLKELSYYRLIGKGEGIHWPDLDEDISVQNLILGKPSGESQHSLQAWLEARASRTS
jgi:hypothetical protein